MVLLEARQEKRRKKAAAIALQWPMGDHDGVKHEHHALHAACKVAMATYVGNKFGAADHEKLADYQKRVDPNDKQAQNLLDEMRAHIKKLEDMRKNEDPRLSFSTPEFKEAQRMFTDNLKKNFGKPVEWGMVKDHPWSTPQLRKLDTPVDVNGKDWPLDEQGQPILKL